MAWDTFSRRRIDLAGRQDDGDKVIAHEFDFSVPDQLIYSRNGVNITSTPVSHYETDGPVALRLDWHGLSVTYSGVLHFSPMRVTFWSRQTSRLQLMHPGHLSCNCSFIAENCASCLR